MVQNQTDAAMDVDVVLQTANLGAGRADRQAGQRARRTTGSRCASPSRRPRPAPPGSGSAPPAVTRPTRPTVELPVYTPATAEAFATYGVVDDGAIVQPVIAPAEVIPQFGGLDVTTSSTSLQALTDAVIYLSEYPYESSDALASRILAIAALRDVLDAFDAPGLPSAGRAGRRRGPRHRTAGRDAERRRRVPVLVALATVRAVQLDPGRARTGGGAGRRATRYPVMFSIAHWRSSPTSSRTSRRSTSQRRARHAQSRTR